MRTSAAGEPRGDGSGEVARCEDERSCDCCCAVLRAEGDGDGARTKAAAAAKGAGVAPVVPMGEGSGEGARPTDALSGPVSGSRFEPRGDGSGDGARADELRPVRGGRLAPRGDAVRASGSARTEADGVGDGARTPGANCGEPAELRKDRSSEKKRPPLPLLVPEPTTLLPLVAPAALLRALGQASESVSKERISSRSALASE